MLRKTVLDRSVVMVLGVVVCGGGLLRCNKQTHYANAKLRYQNNQLTLLADETAKRQPMGLNVDVSMVRGKKGWGLLWQVPYRDASAINRTLTTDVWYLAATDPELRPLFKKPLVLHKADKPSGTQQLVATDKGYAFIYKQASRLCKEIDSSKRKVIGKSRFCRLVKSLWAKGIVSTIVTSIGGAVYGMSQTSNSLTVHRATAAGKHEVVARITFCSDPGAKRTGGSALRVDTDGVQMVWWERVAAGAAPAARHLYSAHCSLANRKCTQEKLPLKVDRPGRLHATLVRTGGKPAALLQIGDRIFLQSFDPKTFRATGHKQLVAIPGGPQQSHPIQMDCRAKECIAFFRTNDGFYRFSTRMGLKKARPQEFFDSFRCGPDYCLKGDNSTVHLQR